MSFHRPHVTPPKSRKKSVLSPFLGKIKDRHIPETVAAFIGGGWFLVEFVHWALIDHYKLPEPLFDLTLISVLCAFLCTVTWRWFRPSGRKKAGFRFEWLLLPVYITITLFLNGRIALRMIHGGENAEYSPEWSNSVAVLAFSDLSPGKDQEYFCEGVAEDIRTKLTRIAPSLKVISRYSVIPYRNTEKSTQQIGRELGVATLLEGTVQKESRRMRIHAQLINASDGSHLWAEEFDREVHSLFDIQDEISLSIVEALKIKLNPGIRETIHVDRPRNMEAYRLYKKATYIISNDYANSQSEADFNRAIGLYHQALSLDSSYANVYASLAWAYQHSYSLSGNPETLALILSNCEKAAFLDPDSPQGLAAQGWLYMNHLDLRKAFEAYKKALKLDPNHFIILHAVGMSYARLGLFRQAVKVYSKAVDLSPFYPNSHGQLGVCLMRLGENEKAETAFRKTLQLSPHNRYYITETAELMLRQGREAEAAELLDQAEKMGADTAWADLASCRGILFALRGDRERALEASRSAEVCAILGMEEESVRLLYGEVQKNPYSIDVSYLYLKNNPFLVPVHRKPEFKKILEGQKRLYQEQSKKAGI